MAADAEPPAGPRYTRPDADPGTIVVLLTGPIARSSIPRLCQRVGMLLEGNDADLVICDVGAIVAPDGETIDALARLQLTARRLGRRVRLLDACRELKELLVLTGLSEVVPCADSLLETGRQAEEREPARRVEEERDPADPIP